MVEIEGLAYYFDKISENQFYVPSSDKSNAFTLLNKPVRLGDLVPNDSHLKDRLKDPDSVIGHIKDVWINEDDNAAYANAIITDPIADYAIRKGAFDELGWSIYSNVAKWDGSAATGLDIESISLVQNPAWPAARWKIAASTDGSKLHFLNPIKLSASDTMIDETKEEGVQTPHVQQDSVQEVDLKKEVEELKQKLAESEKEKQELQTSLLNKVSTEDAKLMALNLLSLATGYLLAEMLAVEN